MWLRRVSGMMLMGLTLGFVIMPGIQSSAAPITVLMAETKNPYGGTAIDPLPATATIFTVTNGKKSVNYSKNDLLAIKSTVNQKEISCTSLLFM